MTGYCCCLFPLMGEYIITMKKETGPPQLFYSVVSQSKIMPKRKKIPDKVPMPQTATAPPLYRTRDDLERVASYGIPGVTRENLEGMVRKKEIVIVEQEQKNRASEPRDPIPTQAEPLPATQADIAWIKDRVPEELVDQRLASGRFVLIDERNKKKDTRVPVTVCPRCKRSIPIDSQYCCYCALPLAAIVWEK
jgi:hypothetical protein